MLQAIYDAMDPVAFTIGPFEVRWYGLAYLFAFIIGAILAYKIARRWKMGVSVDDMTIFLIALIIGAVFGARLGYVLFYGNGYYLSHPDEILAFHNGGMSFHGGVIGAFIGGFIASRITKVNFLAMADVIAVVAPIGLFLGRCANFINGELWGAVTNLPWGVVFDSGGSLPRHPSQLYEAFLEGIVLFLVLYLLSRKKPELPKGSYIGLFMVLYGIFRICVEFVRQPDVQLGYLYGGWLTMGMVLCIPLIAAGVCFLVYAHKTGKSHENLPKMQAVEKAEAEARAASAAKKRARAEAKGKVKRTGKHASDSPEVESTGSHVGDSPDSAGSHASGGPDSAGKHASDSPDSSGEHASDSAGKKSDASSIDGENESASGK